MVLKDSVTAARVCLPATGVTRAPPRSGAASTTTRSSAGASSDSSTTMVPGTRVAPGRERTSAWNGS